MTQIKCPVDFYPLQQVTDTNLNAHVNLATLQPGAIIDQTVLGRSPVAADSLLIYDSALAVLRRTTVSDLTSSNFAINTAAISNSTGTDIVVTVPAGKKLSIVGNGLIESINLNVTTLATLSQASIGSLTFSVTDAMTLPKGTVAQRPATPVAGHTRYNTDSNMVEYFNGTSWLKSGGYQLYSITEVTPTYYTATAAGAWQTAWTSPAMTKPTGEIWILELDTVFSTGGSADLTELQTLYGTAGTVLGYDVCWSNHFGGSGYHKQHTLLRTIVSDTTTLTAETYVIQIKSANIFTDAHVNFTTYPAKFRIYKYKI